MSLRVCTELDCPTLVTSGRCSRHTQPRGYGYAHQRLRAQWQRRINAGPVPCARCGKAIGKGQAWDLDHNADRTAYLGPSCVSCNRAAH